MINKIQFDQIVSPLLELEFDGIVHHHYINHNCVTVMIPNPISNNPMI